MKYRLISLAAAASLILSLVSCVSINLPKKDGAATESESESEYTPPPYDYDVVENNFIHEMNTYLNMLGSADYGAASVMIAAPSASPRRFRGYHPARNGPAPCCAGSGDTRLRTGGPHPGSG